MESAPLTLSLHTAHAVEKREWGWGWERGGPSPLDLITAAPLLFTARAPKGSWQLGLWGWRWWDLWGLWGLMCQQLPELGPQQKESREGLVWGT